MNQEAIDNAIELAIKAARRVNKCKKEKKDFNAMYNLAYLDAILDMLNFNDRSKYYRYITDKNTDEGFILFLVIKTFCENEPDKNEYIKM